MAKLLLILILGGAFAGELVSSQSEPPLLIDASVTAPASPSGSSS
jgi:hypothetical protein